MQLVRAVDIEGDLIDWYPAKMAELGWAVAVSDQLDGVDSMAVYRTGGVMRDMVTDSATIVIECYGKTKTRSAAMVLDARALLHQLAGYEINGHAVSRVQEFGGPALLPTAEALTRYTQTFAVDVAAEIVG